MHRDHGTIPATTLYAHFSHSFREMDCTEKQVLSISQEIESISQPVHKSCSISSELTCLRSHKSEPCFDRELKKKKKVKEVAHNDVEILPFKASSEVHLCPEPINDNRRCKHSLST